ncbi:MAG TPA: alanine--tRNA ligase [Candidatus Nanoarchaeia archaeon]|nr:alanine--tRNA ligase [Candidatus Nanoarchaeia archaeon]
MKYHDLKQKYLDYFKRKQHVIIESAPLIPENDPTVLFTTAGMHPLVPYLVGEKHPLGKRLVDVQKCIRTGDIDEVGDTTHHTFFEMLGNWSLGDYFKKEAIPYTFEFLTKVLKLPIDKLGVSCFKGDTSAPKDEEAAKTWLSLGIPKERIAYLGKEDNWWGPAGETGPCGPCTEIYFWTSDVPAPKAFDVNDKRWVEIGNDVLMEYEKHKDGTFTPLKQKNIDFGGGVERTLAVLNGLDDNYLTEVFLPIIKSIEKMTKRKYADNKRLMRIVADHIRAAVFILGDEKGVVPSNLDQGYILRRFIRRSIRNLKTLGLSIENIDLTPLADVVIKIYKDDYPLLVEKQHFIKEELHKEQEKFKLTLEKGLKEFAKMSDKNISAPDAFLLFQSYGFPLEMTQELAQEKGLTVDAVGFRREFEKHQELSRVGAEQKFKGGLSDASEETKRLHTATHLLNEALRKVISPDIRQRGSNITPERLRFDFNFDRKLTPEEVKAVEEEVNSVIARKLNVIRKEMLLEEAEKLGAQKEFGHKYPPKVSVYFVGDYSKEFCGGPHVSNTSELGHFKIVKEESSAAGIRRIKAVLG